MKIMQICAYAAPYEGNFIKSLKYLNNDLQKFGYETIYVFPETAKTIEWCKHLEKTNIVYYLPLARARIKIKTYIMLKNIFNNHPDIKIAHSHFELYDIPLTMVAPKNVKVFWHLHDAISNYKDLKNKTIHKIQYCFLQKNSFLLSVSEKHMEYVNSLGFSPERSLFLPNGLDINRINKVTKPYEKRMYDFVIFGWDYERKGVDLCIKSLNLISNRYKTAIIASEDSKKIILNNHNNLKNIEIVDPVEDVNCIFNEAKCFLHISRAEGLSYALLEALYAGLNVICSDIAENQFAIQFPTVHMVESENVDMISEAMKRIILLNYHESNTVEMVRSIIEEKYSTKAWAKRVKKEYGIYDD